MKPTNKLPPWLKPKSAAVSPRVAVNWYTPAEWAKVKASSIDAERFENTYEEWLEMAEKALVGLRANGVAAYKSHIDAGQLLAWCLAHGKANEAASRAEYVAEQSRRHGH